MGRKPIPYNDNHKEMDGVLYKKCNKHEELFPSEDPWFYCTDEYFSKNDKNKIDGLNSYCRKCNNSIRRPNSKRRKTVYKKPPLTNISTRLRRIYINMVQRCYNVKNTAYINYGERGINICDEWLEDRYNFFEWALNNGYKEDLTIERKNVNGNYEPNNCTWATRKEQSDNRRKTILIDYNGETKTLVQWSKEMGISPQVLMKRFIYKRDKINQDGRCNIFIEKDGEFKSLKQLSKESGLPYKALLQRYNAGWDIDNLLNDLMNKTKYIEINGEIHTVKEWAEISGLTKQLIENRISKGWKDEDLIKPKSRNNKSNNK